MPWFSKRFLLLAVVCVPVSLLGVSYQLNSDRSEKSAKIETRFLSTNGSVAPVELSLSLPTMDLNRNEDGFDSVDISGLSTLGGEGNPAVLTSGTILAVPDGFKPVLKVVENTEREFQGVTLRPVQRKLRCGGGRNDSFVFNGKLYGSQAVYPELPVKLEPLGKMQELELVRVGFYPVRQDLGAKKLVVSTNLKAQVTFEPIRRGKRVELPRTFFRLANTLTANLKGIKDSVRVSQNPEVMIIISADGLKDSMNPLVQWKQSKGMKVEMFTFTEAGGSKEKVQKFIQNYYDTHTVKPTYLLMVGNKTTNPAFFEDIKGGGPDAVSDYHFSLLSGNDTIPDLFYGRILADNTGEVDTQVKRIVDYEKNPDRGTWYPNGTTIASDGQSPDLGTKDTEYAEQIQSALKTHTFKAVDQFYEEPGTATAANISKAINEGRSYLTYIGHGSGTAWQSTNDTFSNTTVGKLKNPSRLPVIVDVACLNASWASSISKPFGKAWITHQDNGTPAGAVAYYGGSVSISWDEPAIMAVGVAKYHFEKPLYTFGASVLAGQMYLVEKLGNGDNTLDNLKWYNLFGDPSLVMRTDVPKPILVKAVSNRTRQGVEVTVTATDSTGGLLPNLTASLHMPGKEPLAVGKTDTKGETVLALPGLSDLEPNTTITVTGYNTETYEGLVW